MQNTEHVGGRCDVTPADVRRLHNPAASNSDPGSPAPNRNLDPNLNPKLNHPTPKPNPPDSNPNQLQLPLNRLKLSL